MDRIASITAKNHGDYVSQVAAIMNEAKTLGLLNANQKGAVDSCAAK
jgi:hypothetical protein